MQQIASGPNRLPESDQMLRSKLIDRVGRLRPESIEGLFIGTAIGDALGLPLETLTSTQISERFGKVRKILSPITNKYIGEKGARQGMISDDTQLTLAVARGLIAQAGVPLEKILDAIAAEHVEALKATTVGWGKTTEEAVKKLSSGIHWKDSGTPGGPNAGKGNGVVMKIAPLAAFAISRGYSLAQTLALVDSLCKMTHNSPLAIASARAHVAALHYVLLTDRDHFSPQEFVDTVVRISETSTPQDKETAALTERFRSLAHVKAMNLEQITAAYGGGSCYVLDSLPFTYAFFLREWRSTDSLYSVANAGGDTDSNAAMVGALLGALHGKSIFPDEVVAELLDAKLITETAGKFALALVTN